MIGVDTNVVIRYLAQDDAKQSALATRLIENQCSAAMPAYICLVVLVEVVWVSESCYGATRSEIATIVRRLLSVKQFVVQETEIAWQALRLFEASKADFSDCLIKCGAVAAGCDQIMTFDKQAANSGMSLLK